MTRIILEDGVPRVVSDRRLAALGNPLSAPSERTAEEVAAFRTSTGLQAELDALTGNGAVFAQRSAGALTFEAMMLVAAYLRSMGATIPDDAALFVAWAEQEHVEPPLPQWVQPGATNPYPEGAEVQHAGKPWRSIVAHNVWEPGHAGAPTWIDLSPPPATPQPWRQRTPGVDMYGVGPHPEGAAVIGTLRVLDGGRRWLLVAPDSTGHAPSVVGSSTGVWQDEGPA